MSQFDSTHWSIVLEAGHRSSPDCGRALEALCQSYWYPLYAYVRRHGHDVHEAQDLTQEFFTRLLEKNVIASADPNRGRFRSFLLAAFRNFLANEWDKTRAQKRGGGTTAIALDSSAGESRYSIEPTHELTPHRLYEREWAATLLDHVMTRLRGEFVCSGREKQFEQLQRFIGGQTATSYCFASAES